MSDNNDLQVGTFRVRAVPGSAELGHASTGTEQIAIAVEFIDGPNKDRRAVWFGAFSENAVDRTLESMRYLGWDSDELADLSGLGSTEAEAVVAEDEYNGKVRARIQWINRPRGPSLKNKMDDAQLRAFSARMKGKAIASRKALEAKGYSPASNGNATQQRKPPVRSDGPPPHTDEDLGF